MNFGDVNQQIWPICQMMTFFMDRENIQVRIMYFILFYFFSKKTAKKKLNRNRESVHKFQRKY